MHHALRPLGDARRFTKWKHQQQFGHCCPKWLAQIKNQTFLPHICQLSAGLEGLSTESVAYGLGLQVEAAKPTSTEPSLLTDADRMEKIPIVPTQNLHFGPQGYNLVWPKQPGSGKSGQPGSRILWGLKPTKTTARSSRPECSEAGEPGVRGHARHLAFRGCRMGFPLIRT